MRTALIPLSSHQSSAGHRPSGARSAGHRLAPPRYGVDLVDRPGGAARLQMKARLGASNDPLEHEADRLADVVMNGGFAGPVSRAAPQTAQRACHCGEDGLVQRKCAACEEEEQTVRRAPGGVAGGGSAATAAQAVSGGGAPLPASARAFFGPRFGRDFSDVRIHTGPGAAAAARGIGARAYTLGADIAFGAGEYAPGTPAGKRLLAHELAHVVQQGGAGDTIRRAELEILPANSAAVPTANQRKAAASCDISCGGTAAVGASPAEVAAAASVSVGTLHAMPLFFHTSRGAPLADATGADGIGASLHFIRNGTNPAAGNPCAACTDWKIIQVLRTNQTSDARGKEDYVDNASAATPFYDDVYAGATGLHTVPAAFKAESGNKFNTRKSIYDTPFRAALAGGKDFFWEAEACVTCVKAGKDKVLGCATYGFKRTWVPTPPAPGAPPPAAGAPPAGAFGPVQATGPGCLASPSAHFSATLRSDTSTNTYDFET